MSRLTIQEIATMTMEQVNERLLELDILIRADEVARLAGLISGVEAAERKWAWRLEQVVLQARAGQIARTKENPPKFHRRVRSGGFYGSPGRRRGSMTKLSIALIWWIGKRLPLGRLGRRLSLEEALDRSLAHGYYSVEWRGTW